MKLVIQRVKEAQVEVENKVVGKINQGFLVLVGITHEDTKEIADYLVRKLCKLRVFSDENKKMNLNIKDVNRRIVNSFSIYFICRLYTGK
jgi:D-tyrosyl-tRNA(Tyr) deacylase